MKLKTVFVALALAPVLCVLCAAGQVAQAEPPMRFHAGSLESIEEGRKGKPFLLVLWSLDCAPCRVELKHIRAAMDANRAPDIVFIATDTPDRSDRIEAILSAHGLSQIDSWVFDDPVPERLRQKIDPDWYGELPRAYYYDKSHVRKSLSGAINQEALEKMASRR